MAFKIKVSSLATRNIDNALEFFHSKSKSSAKNFKKKLSEAYKTLKTNPYFALRYHEVRALPLINFPYLIFFDIDEELRIVNILSVFCTYQNPEKYP